MFKLRYAVDTADRPANLLTADTLEDYKVIPDSEHKKILVVQIF